MSDTKPPQTTPTQFFVKYSAKPIAVDGECIELLLEAGAGDTAHSGGRTLLDHCVGVFGLMQIISVSKSAALAGLVHSIYSTDAFETQCLPLEARPRVAEVVGDRAEQLAYWFCAMDRSDFVFSPVVPGKYSLYDRFTGKHVALAKDEFYDLLDLVFANEIEQLHPRTHGYAGDGDGSADILAALLPNVSKEAIIFYDRMFRNNAAPLLSETPEDETSWAPRFSPLFLASVPEAAKTGVQADWFAQITEPGVEFCENDFWDLWIRVVPPGGGALIDVALPPIADYTMLQVHLSRVLGLNPAQEAVLGLVERGSGPVLSLEFLGSDDLWLLIPEYVYGAMVVPATAASLRAHGLDTALATSFSVADLMPGHFDLEELRAEMFVPGSSLVASFCASAHTFGSLSLTIAPAHIAVIRRAIDSGDAFFDLDMESKDATSIEFDDNKFAGFATNRFRDWFQVRNVFDQPDVSKSYGPNPEFSRQLLALFLLLEGIARDVTALLAIGIGVDPALIFDLCDKPGLPPVMQPLLGSEGVAGLLADETMVSRYDRGPDWSPAQTSSSTSSHNNNNTSGGGGGGGGGGGAKPMDVASGPSGSSRPWQRQPEKKRYPGSNVMRFFRYHTGRSPDDQAAFKNSYPSSPHADLGLVTIAPVSPNPALEVQSHLTEGTVLVEENLRPAEDVTIMLGETLGYLTRGYYRAPFHRVIPNYTHTRYSMPFFLRAHPLAEANPAKLCSGIDALPQSTPSPNIEPSPPYLIHEVMDLVVQSRPLGIPEYTDY